MSLVSVNFERI